LGDTTEFKLTAEACLRDGFDHEPAFEGLVAESDGHVVGYLLYHMGYDSDLAQRTLHVADLYVDADSRRRGIGKTLMAKAAAIARERGAGEMIWSVFTANDMAAAFYEGLGAQRITEVYFMKLNANAT
jgi:ribosomal protein S18 acetylase RimI-like enzyme